jgi:hypothetical protein
MEKIFDIKNPMLDLHPSPILSLILIFLSLDSDANSEKTGKRIFGFKDFSNYRVHALRRACGSFRNEYKRSKGRAACP